MTSRVLLYDALTVLVVSAVVIASLSYAQLSGTYDATTLAISVVLPLVFGSIVFSVRKKLTLLFAFQAYFWAVVDDAPVFFDSVLTWPQVTRFHPFLPRLSMNIVIHALTVLFLYLTIRESLKGTHVRLGDASAVIILTSFAFVLAYAQNIPLAYIQNLVSSNWYPFDVTEKLASLLCLCLAVRAAAKLKANAFPVGVVEKEIT